MSKPKSNRGTMKLTNVYMQEFTCQVCELTHTGMIKPDSDGRFYPDAWHCTRGCTWEDLESLQAEEAKAKAAQ